jgi:hypothetical protein
MELVEKSEPRRILRVVALALCCCEVGISTA